MRLETATLDQLTWTAVAVLNRFEGGEEAFANRIAIAA